LRLKSPPFKAAEDIKRITSLCRQAGDPEEPAALSYPFGATPCKDPSPEPGVGKLG
jgi:hypothetical protein